MFEEFSERIEVDYLEFFKSRVKIRSEIKQLRDSLQSQIQQIAMPVMKTS